MYDSERSSVHWKNVSYSFAELENLCIYNKIHNTIDTGKIELAAERQRKCTHKRSVRKRREEKEKR